MYHALSVSRSLLADPCDICKEAERWARYLAAGSQRLESEQGVTCGYSTAPLYGSLQAVKATEKAEDSSKVNVYCNKKYIGDVAMMFFQGTAPASEWKADSSKDAWKEAWKNF